MPHAERPSYLRSLSSFAQKDKPRLYIALYPRETSAAAECDQYHWALVFGSESSSRKDPVTRYQLAHYEHQWTEQHALTFDGSDSLHNPTVQQSALIRIAVAKVLNPERAIKILKGIRQHKSRDEESCCYDTCFHWVQDAFIALHDAGFGVLKSYFEAEDWPYVEKCTRDYVRQKRREGRFTLEDGNWDPDEISTFNAWEKRETAK